MWCAGIWGLTSGDAFDIVLKTTEKKTVSKWYDFGTLGGASFPRATHAAELVLTQDEYDNAKVSGLQNVSSIWFGFNGDYTTQTRDCYSYITRIALRYIYYKKSAGEYRHRITDATVKVGDYQLNSGYRESRDIIVGYQVPDSERDRLKSDNMYLAGCRIQFKLKRGAAGPQEDLIFAVAHRPVSDTHLTLPTILLV